MSAGGGGDSGQVQHQGLNQGQSQSQGGQAQTQSHTQGGMPNQNPSNQNPAAQAASIRLLAAKSANEKQLTSQRKV